MNNASLFRRKKRLTGGNFCLYRDQFFKFWMVIADFSSQ